LVLLSSWTWFQRPSRSQPDRTRREDRRLKFYELRDNLLAPPRVLRFIATLRYESPRALATGERNSALPMGVAVAVVVW